MTNRQRIARLNATLSRDQNPKVNRAEVLWALDILEQFLDGNNTTARAMLDAGPKHHLEDHGRRQGNDGRAEDSVREPD